MIEAIGKARESMFEATLALGTGSASIGFNRRRVRDGKLEMWWRNAEKQPSHPLDPVLSVLRVQDPAGRARAVLVHYACHATVLGPDNLQYSADYPGAMRRLIEKERPGVTALFVQGAAGDINPFFDKQPVADRGLAVMEETGAELGRAALGPLDRARPLKTAGLRLASETREFRNRWKADEKTAVGLTAGVIGGDVCFLALPGEPFIEHQVAFREKSECAAGLLFGYSYSAGGDWAGYLPTIRAAVEGGYGAGYNTTVEVGAGETLVDRGVVHLYRLRGLLGELPQ